MKIIGNITQELRDDIIKSIVRIGYNKDYIKNKYNLSNNLIKYITCYIKGQENFPFSEKKKENIFYQEFEENFEKFSKMKKIELIRHFNSNYQTVAGFFYYYNGKNKTTEFLK